MRKWMRVLGIGLLVLGALAIIAYGVVYAGSQRLLNQTYASPLLEFVAPEGDSLLLAEGERLARIRGCIGCHGMDMEGGVFFDEPLIAKIVAPDLTRMAAEYSDAELERVIRRGVQKDGKSVWAMPSPMFYHLSDADLGAMIAYIRSVEPRGGPGTEFQVRVLGRVGLVSGQFPPLVDEIDPGAPRLAIDLEDSLSVGRYLAVTSCTECHGATLRGGFGVPDLKISQAFSSEAFFRLMREGVGLGDRELEMMGGVARNRFAYLTDAEIRSIHAYLSSLGDDE